VSSQQPGCRSADRPPLHFQLCYLCRPRSPLLRWRHPFWKLGSRLVPTLFVVRRRRTSPHTLIQIPRKRQKPGKVGKECTTEESGVVYAHLTALSLPSEAVHLFCSALVITARLKLEPTGIGTGARSSGSSLSTTQCFVAELEEDRKASRVRAGASGCVPRAVCLIALSVLPSRIWLVLRCAILISIPSSHLISSSISIHTHLCIVHHGTDPKLLR
jgi:hypothetical protein